MTLTRHLPSLVLICSLAAVGCSDDTRFDDINRGGKDNPKADAGSDAAAADGGGHAGDAGLDGGGGLGMLDGSQLDASDDDGGMDPDQLDPTKSCSVDDTVNAYDDTAAFSDESGFALTPGETGFAVAYYSLQTGHTAGITTLNVPGQGKFGKPYPLIIDTQFAVFPQVALGWSSGAAQLAWADNAQGRLELEAQGLNAKLQFVSGGFSNKVTDNAFEKSRPVYATIAGKTVLAWIETDVANGTGVSCAHFDGSVQRSELLSMKSGHKPSRIALAQLGTKTGALAWVDEEAEHGVWLQALDEDQKPSGKPALLTDFVSVGGSVDLGTREKDGGAVLYSVVVDGSNHEVRFRRLDEKAGFMGDDIKIVGSPLQAQDASFAHLGGGYVVAYRALPGGIITKPEIRMAFITKEGNVTRDKAGRLVSYHVADAGAYGGRLTVRVSVDGEILIGGVDGVQSNDKKFRLFRKRLDCAL